jgi:short-subunit dehydrogenase
MRHFPGAAMYAASKAFTTQFTQGLSIELLSSKIDVQCLNPFGTATNIIDHKGLQLIGTPCNKVISKSLGDLGRSKTDCMQYGTAFNEFSSRLTFDWLLNSIPFLGDLSFWYTFTYLSKQ